MEASIIAPITILCIILLIQMAAILYQKIYLQKEADIAVERAAAIWSNTERDIETGALAIRNLEGDGLYWRLVDWQKSDKLDRLKYSINFEKSVFKGEESVTADIVDYIFYKKLIVKVEGEYPILGGEILKIFGLKGKYNIKVYSEAVIDEPTEFIRNADLAVDTVREIEREFPQLGQVGNKLRETMDEINKRISNFFNDG